MTQQELDMMELNRLHNQWREIKKRKLGQQMDSLQNQMDNILTQYADGIVEMYNLAFHEDIIVQNKENISETQEMLFSMYAPAGITKEKAQAFAGAFNDKFGTHLVPEVYSETEFSFSVKM